MNQVLIEKVTHQLETLPDDLLQRVSEFIETLEGPKLRGTPGRKLLKFAGTITPEDADTMLQVIEQDCRKVDIHEW